MINLEEERKVFLYELDGHGYTFTHMKWLGGCFEDSSLQMAWEMWQASANREGFVLVPKEPTEEMINAGGKANSECLNENAPLGERLYRHPALKVYKDMIGAKP